KEVPVTSKDPNPLDPSDPDYPAEDPDYPGCTDCTVTPLVKDASMEIVKTSLPAAGFLHAGDVIKYEIEVKNTGNVTLFDIVVTDENADNLNVGTIVELEVGKAKVLEAFHTITQADMDAGYVSNIAKGKGKDPKGEPVEAESKSGNPVDPNDPTDPTCADCTITPLPWRPITADDDAVRGINGKTGKTDVLNALVNDLLDGVQVLPKDVVIAVNGVTITDPVKFLDKNGALIAGVVFNAKGGVDVKPGTAAGDYTLTYSICEVLNPSNCAQATITITVDAAPIEAVVDTPPAINGKDGGKTPSVVENDTLNGDPIDPKDIGTEVTVTVETPATPRNPGEPVPTLDPSTGIVTVDPATPAGDYEITYKICEVLNPDNCSTTTVTVTVTPAPIEAVVDTPPAINGKDGGKTPSVIDNDRLNNKPVDPSEVVLTWGKTPNKGITPNPDGTITVSPETPAGEYEVPYQICEVLNPSNCATTTITIVVEEAEIKAVDDKFGPYNGKDGDRTPSVLDNDVLNGKPVDAKDIKLTPGTSPHKGIVMYADGTINVAPNTPKGEYVYTYRICELLNPTNCADAIATIIVEAPEIDAVNDKFVGVGGEQGTQTPSVLDNDLLNKKSLVPTDVKLTWLDDAPEGLTLNIDGTITIAPGTKAGIHTIFYQICEVLNPSNCDKATVELEVLPTPIRAKDDELTVEWSRDNSITASVLDNDTFNEGAVDLSKVTLRPGIPSEPSLTMNPDGTINVPASTRPGTYEFPYTICEVLNPSNCSEAMAHVVIKSSDLFIPNVFTPNGDGVNDVFEIIGMENFDQVDVLIINRWGNEVYKSTNYRNTWDGKGLNEGTYYYIITTHKGGNSNKIKGWVLIKTR
ncbi:gliding motility-associated C-terminal domain-containing protein, partial [Sphingobacterium sp. UT-1RO-CII-1]|uniref:gliding motility-associated C-terminal domain-containing protein n=1 Tax=Sphingobacterium sp. UT-1RO-CII-1 TaxID=2995225 RepID=UPI00227B7A7D